MSAVTAAGMAFYYPTPQFLLNNERFSLKNLVYNINLINFAHGSRAESRDRSFFRIKRFIK